MGGAVFLPRLFSAIVAYWQALLWLLHQPALWRQHIEQIDPSIKADFAWRDLQGGLWHHPRILQLFSLIHITAPLSIASFSALWCLVFFDAHTAARAFVYTATLVFVGGLFTAVLVSSAFALLSTSLIGFFVGISFGLTQGFTVTADLLLYDRPWYVLIFLICLFGLAAASQSLITLSTWNETPEPLSRSFRRTMGIVVAINLIFFSALIWLVISVLPGITYSYLIDKLWIDTLELSLSRTQQITSYSLIYTFYVSLLVLILLVKSLKNWHLATIIAAIFFILMGTLMSIDLVKSSSDWTVAVILVRPLVGSLANTIFLALLFAIPFLMLRMMFRNIYFGIYAGLLASAGVYFFVFSQKPLYHVGGLLLGIFCAVSLGFLLMRRNYALGFGNLGWFILKRFHRFHKDSAPKKMGQKKMALKWLEKIVSWLADVSDDYKEIRRETTQNVSDILEKGKQITNKYSSTPLTAKPSEQIFVGREKTIRRIQSYLESDKNIPILLWGQRRIGKTSFAYKLKERLPDKFTPLYVNMQAVAAMARSEADFFFVFARRLYLADPDNIALPQRKDYDGNPWIVFDEFLDNLEQTYPNKRIQLILDEFELLEKVFEDSVLEQDRFLGYLRDLLQHRPRLNVLLVGFHFVSELPSWSTYFTSVLDVNIGYLSDDDVHNLVQPSSFEFPLRYEPEAYGYLCKVTHNHPMMLQILCWQLVERVNEREHVYAEQNRALICKADIEAVIDVGRYRNAFANMLTVNSTLAAFLIPFAKKGADYQMPEQDVIEALSDDLLRELYREGTMEKDARGNVGFTLEPVRRTFAERSLSPSNSH